MNLVIKGNTPSQKNRKIISQNRATGRPFLRTAPAVKVWQDSAFYQLRVQAQKLPAFEYPIALNVVIWYGNKRRHDLDNGLSSVLDALVAARIIPDDNTDHLSCITVQFGGYDKDNPRVEIDLDS